MSQDPNAEILALTYLPTIVVSASALKSIMGNVGPNYGVSTWTIPVTVRSYKKQDDFGNVIDVQTVIFVDKPLPPKSLSAREKNDWYNKIASKAFLLHPWTRSRHPVRASASDFKSGNKSWMEEAGEDDPFGMSDTSNLETFGTIGQFDGNLSDSDDDEDSALVIAEENTEKDEDKSEDSDLNKKQLGAGPSKRSSRGRRSAQNVVTETRRSTRSASRNEQEEDGDQWSARRLRKRVLSGESNPKSAAAPYGFVKRPGGKRGRRKATTTEVSKKVEKEHRIVGFKENSPVELPTSGEEDEEGVEDEEVEFNLEVEVKVENEDKEGKDIEQTAPDDKKSREKVDPMNERIDKVDSKNKGIDQDDPKDKNREEDTRSKKMFSSQDVSSAFSSPFMFEAKSKPTKSGKELPQRKVESPKKSPEKKKDSNIDANVATILGGIMAEQKSTLDLLAKEKAEEDEMRRRLALERRNKEKQYQGGNVAYFDWGLRQEEFLQPAEDRNVAYRLFNLWDKSAKDTSNIRVVVRCETHGILRYIFNVVFHKMRKKIQKFA